MLTSADDYPLHQTPEPMAFAGTDRNFYDRFFFNGYSPDGDYFFALALGVYPQLNIMDASFCVSVEGQQTNLRASKEMHGDRLNLNIGPITLEIVSPMAQTRITITDNESGLTAELVATGRHFPIEEPRFTRRQGTRLMMDVTRATQNIDWHGTLSVNGVRHDVSACRGTRDRSWGIRQVGAAESQPPAPAVTPQFYWLWTPVNFDGGAFFCHTNDDEAGVSWNRKAVFYDMQNDTKTEWGSPQFDTAYHAGTRRVSGVQLKADGLAVTFTPLRRLFYMQGLGYIHPQWGHGVHHGPLRVAHDVIELSAAEAELKAGKMENLHIQTLAEVSLQAQGTTHKGVGVIEQLFIGPHAPSGFSDLLDKIVG
jgi:hypothetical protein